jgi:hypothetical protein
MTSRTSSIFNVIMRPFINKQELKLVRSPSLYQNTFNPTVYVHKVNIAKIKLLLYLIYTVCISYIIKDFFKKFPEFLNDKFTSTLAF